MPVVEVNGIPLYYELSGKGEDTIVFIMGLGMPGFMWEPQVMYFSKNYRVLIFDNRGVGKSGKPVGPYTTEMMADDTAGLMEKLEIERAHIVGMSMGGMIAQWMGIKYPKKTKSLVLAVTYAIADERVARHVREGAKLFGIEDGKSVRDLFFSSLRDVEWTEEMFKKIVEFLIPLLLSQQFIESRKDDLKNWMKKMFENPPTLNSFISQVMATQTHNTLDKLHTIRVPVLVISGTADKLVPLSCSRDIAQKIEGAHLIELEGAPHGMNFEREEEFNRMVEDFIKKVAKKGYK